MKKWFKFLLFIIFISSYMFSAFLILAMHFFSFNKARQSLVNNISFHSKIALKIFGIKLKIIGDNNFNQNNYLVVSNHLSYIDILVISSVIPTCFVTSVEMKETPFLGKLCKLGGCIFVERRSKKGIASEVSQLSNALSSGLNVTIFPEAKSTNGSEVLKFRAPLFHSAIETKTKTLPLVLNYKSIDGKKINLQNRDRAFWYDDMNFFVHMLGLLDSKYIEVDINILEKFEIKDEWVRQDLALFTHSVISENYNPIV